MASICRLNFRGSATRFKVPLRAIKVSTYNTSKKEKHLYTVLTVNRDDQPNAFSGTSKLKYLVVHFSAR